MDRKWIAELASSEENARFEGFFLVLSRQVRTTQTNKPYLNLILCDRTGQIEARAWELADPRVTSDLQRGDLVKVRGYVQRYNDRPQIKIEQLRKTIEGEADRTEMMPATTYDVQELWSRLQGFIDSFTDPHLKQLVANIFNEPQIAGAFREAPAAKQLHHAWLGGLLEHVISLLTLADRVAPHYPILHRDLLLTGVLLHDIGKIHELSWDIGFEYTTEGTLLGHIQIGASLAEKAMDAIPAFPPRLKTLVLHVILSHHGKLEFGSPKLPMIPEALVLNFLDDLDAKMQAVQGEFDRCAREGKPADELTGKVWALDQRQMLNTRAWLQDEQPQKPAAGEPVQTALFNAES